MKRNERSSERRNILRKQAASQRRIREKDRESLLLVFGGAAAGKAGRDYYKQLDPEQKRKSEYRSWQMLALVLVLAAAFLGLAFSRSAASRFGITTSTRKREPLPSGSLFETSYSYDALGWFTDVKTLEKGMKEYYRRTGVQPFLYLTDRLGSQITPTEADFQREAAELYADLFNDQGHLLVIVYANALDSAAYRLYLYAGSRAASVLDQEALNILKDYIQACYRDLSKYPEGSRDRIFSDAFKLAGRGTMKVYRSPWPGVFCSILALLVLFILWDFRNAMLKQRAEKAAAEKKEKQKYEYQT